MERQRPTRMEILSLLKKQGQMTAQQVGEALGVTPMGARQHLTAMERDELVASEFIRQKAGRPALYFRLGAKAAPYFPQRYDALALSFLRSLEDLDGREKVVEVLQTRRNKLQEEYKQHMVNGGLNGNLRERIEKLTELRDQDGYMAECSEKEYEFTIIEHNCPIHCIAEQFPEVCRQELELFESILGRPVQRYDHMIQGRPACVYKITKKQSL